MEAAFAIFGEALSDVRDEVMYQIHFGADYSKGTYGWTLNLDTVKRSVDKQLEGLKYRLYQLWFYTLPG